LVLHGGSGSGEDNLRKAVAGGINKINVCTDAFEAGKTAMLKEIEKNPEIDYMHLCMAAEARDQAVCKGLYEGDRFQRKIYLWSRKAGRK
jgi:fructose/tagatose bisphosphate aldolase